MVAEPLTREASTAASKGAEQPRFAWRARQLILLAVVLVVVGWLAFRNRDAIDISRWWSRLEPQWAMLALVGSACTIFGNALNLMGASPTTLRFWPTSAVQATGTVARLVTPAAVGGAAVNVQYLRKTGTSGVAAVGAVTVAQTVQMLTTLVLLVPIGFAAGADLVPLRGRGLVLLAVAILLAVVVASVLFVVRKKPKRREQFRRLADDLTNSVQAMLREPERAVVSAGGSVLISVGLIGSLWSAVHAFGGTLTFWSATCVLLLGSTAGNAVPVPGGVGSVDAALVVTLTFYGVVPGIAVPAVILHRLATLWLQVPVGVAFLPWLRRRAYL